MNQSLTQDCEEYDACAELSKLDIQPCYEFPGNAAFDVECRDTSAADYIPGGPEFR